MSPEDRKALISAVLPSMEHFYNDAFADGFELATEVVEKFAGPHDKGGLMYPWEIAPQLRELLEQMRADNEKNRSQKASPPVANPSEGRAP